MKRLPYWFPGAGFRRYALYVKNMIAKQRRLPHDWVRKQMVRIMIVCSQLIADLLGIEGNRQGAAFVHGKPFERLGPDTSKGGAHTMGE